jgi:predicted esterase
MLNSRTMAQVSSTTFWRRWRVPLLVLCALTSVGVRVTHADPAAPAWCAPELHELTAGVCELTSQESPPDTLVIFLHGVIKPDTSWQHQQQRAIARAAAVNGFDVLMPRGRRGVGPKGMQDWWTWPTGATAQQQVEPEILAEWSAARTQLEARRGAAYSRVLVFGFSNGAYYATQLALRGKSPGQGTALFAGGASGDWLERHAKAAKPRVPLYVECGSRDKTAVGDARRLHRMLERLGWAHRFVERKGSGHSMPDAGLKKAFEYLSQAITPPTLSH